MSKDPLTEVIDHQVDALSAAFGELGAIVREYRAEVSWLAVASLAYGSLYLALGRAPVAAAAYLGILVACLFWVGHRADPRYRLLHRSLDAARIRRRWDRAVRHCGFSHVIPISRIEHAEGGYKARIRVGWGISLRDLQLQKERLAASIGIGELWIDRDPDNAATGTALLTIVIPNDYLAGAAKTQWPLVPPGKR